MIALQSPGVATPGIPTCEFCLGDRPAAIVAIALDDGDATCLCDDHARLIDPLDDADRYEIRRLETPAARDESRAATRIR